MKADLNQTRLDYAAYNQAEFSPIFNQFINRSPIFSNKDVITTHPTTYVIVSDRSFEQVLQPVAFPFFTIFKNNFGCSGFHPKVVI